MTIWDVLCILSCIGFLIVLVAAIVDMIVCVNKRITFEFGKFAIVISILFTVFVVSIING